MEFNNVLEYRDGWLYWKIIANRRNAHVGDRAGVLRPDGYYTVTLNGKKYLLHRLIFYMHHGFWPKITDHIDRNKGNNRIENLREVTSYENSRNRDVFKQENEGISEIKGRFQLIYHRKYIGRFGTVEEARSAREAIEGGICGL